MTWQSRITLVCTFLSAIGCADSADLPSGPRAPTAALFDISGSETDVTPLPSVTISGPGADGFMIESSGAQTYTVSVEGGTGTYTIRWFHKRCAINVGCGEYIQPLDGEGDTASIYIAPNNYLNWVQVQVRDVYEGGSSRSAVVHFEGPSNYPEGGDSGGTAFCNTGTAGWAYPFTHYVFNSSTGTFTANGTYRRNPCSGIKEFAP